MNPSSPDDSDSDLSPQSVAFLSARLTEEADMAAPDVSDEEFARFLTQDLAPDQSERLREFLVRAPNLRSRLIVVGDTLEELQASSWAEVVTLARENSTAADGTQTAVAAAWKAITEKWVSAQDHIARARQLQEEGWEALWRSHNSGLAAAGDAWVAFSHAARAGLTRTVPAGGLYAMGRGAAMGGDPLGSPEETDSLDVADLPEPYARVTSELAEATADGALRVRVRLHRKPLATLSSETESEAREYEKTIGLAISDGVAHWTVASARVADDTVEWHVPDLATALDLSVGPLSWSRFRIEFTLSGADDHIGVENAAPSPSRTIYAAMDAEAGGMSRPTSLPLLCELLPDDDTDELSRLRIRLPESGYPLVASHDLVLSVALGDVLQQKLATIKPEDWPEDKSPLLLPLPLPGKDRADRRRSFTLLSARLQSPQDSSSHMP